MEERVEGFTPYLGASDTAYLGETPGTQAVQQAFENLSEYLDHGGLLMTGPGIEPTIPGIVGHSKGNEQVLGEIAGLLGKAYKKLQGIVSKELPST